MECASIFTEIILLMSLNTLQMAQYLEERGFTPFQSAGIAEQMRQAVQNSNLVTNDFLKAAIAESTTTIMTKMAELKTELTTEFVEKTADLEVKISQSKIGGATKMDQVKADLETKMGQLEIRLTGKIEQLETKMIGVIGNLKTDMIKWMIALILTLICFLYSK